MGLSIMAFQALHGDCILLSFTESGSEKVRNILVDTGFSSTYYRTVKPALARIIDVGQILDLVIITHVDNDHISGFIPLLLEFGVDHIGKVWYNYSPDEQTLPRKDGLIGVAEGMKVRDFLKKYGRLGEELVHALQVYNFYEVEIAILSPHIDDWNKFARKWRVSEEKLGATENSLIGPRHNDKTFPIEELFLRPTKLDTSVSNRSSIACLIRRNNLAILLTSDAHPDVLCDSLRSMGYTAESPIKLNLMQVGHHGSRHNTSYELLKYVDCNNFLVSSNSRNPHLFPHKETLAKIVAGVRKRNLTEAVHFYFTYDEPALRNLFTTYEMEKFNIVCIFPERDRNGALIKFE